MFPIWFFYLFPPLWLIIIPINIIVDGLVFYWGLKKAGVETIKEHMKKHMVPIVLVGFFADILGAGIILGFLEWVRPFMVYTFPKLYVKEWGHRAVMDYVGLALVVALVGYGIYEIHKRFLYKKSNFTKEQIKSIAIKFAIFTAPYTFLIPTEWIYK